MREDNDENIRVIDRYGKELEFTDKKPTVEQAVLSWYLVNELISLGYPHNFQAERSDIRNYMYDASSLIDKARKIAYLKNTVEPGMEKMK